MDVNKIVWKSILTTLVSALALLIVMFGALCLFFPSTMMQVSYNVGLDKASASFAKTAYDRSNNIYYIAYATDVSIGIQDEENIVCYGELLVENESFSEYCARRNAQTSDNGNYQATGTYEQYIYRQICISIYRKDAAKAIERAFATLGVDDGSTALHVFPRMNAVFALYVEARAQGDTDTSAKIKGKMERLQIELSSEEQANYEEWLAFMERENG